MNYTLTGEAKDLLTQTKTGLTGDAQKLRDFLAGLEDEITAAPKGTGVDLTPARTLADSLLRAASDDLGQVAAALRPHSPNNDGKDGQGYPLGWNEVPDALPGAVPPAAGMMPGNARPEQAVTPGATLGRDPNFSVTGEPATDPKDFAPADGGQSALSATTPGDSPAAPDQQADAAQQVQADAQDTAKTDAAKSE